MSFLERRDVFRFEAQRTSSVFESLLGLVGSVGTARYLSCTEFSQVDENSYVLQMFQTGNGLSQGWPDRDRTLYKVIVAWSDTFPRID
jgi:hypothetical protein